MDLAAEIGRSVRTSFCEHADSFRSTTDVRSMKKNEDDEVELQWAAIDRLPTFERIRTSLFDYSKDENKEDEASNKSKMVPIDVSKLGLPERHVVIEKLIKEIEEDNHRLLQKLRERIDRMTLLLGPPGCGKSTFLQVLAGKLNHSLKVRGDVTYNGYKLNEFVPQKTSAYTSQYDLHISEMTVREVLDFAARCQGIGSRAGLFYSHLIATVIIHKTRFNLEAFATTDIMKEVTRREKQEGIVPDSDVDTYMKVVSKKDQAKYWYYEDQPHNYVTVNSFVNMFKDFHVGKKLDEELREPFNRSEFHKDALSSNIYSLRKWELFKACLAREWLLMKCNSFVHVFKSAQLVVIALVTMTVFLRTWMKVDEIHSEFFMSSLFYALLRLVCNGTAELSMTASRLAVFYKQRDFYFYPAWAYLIPSAILKIPFSLIDSFLWTALTYYVIGYSPEPNRFFKQFIVLFLVHQVAISLFRLIASLVRNPSLAAPVGLFSLIVMFLFGGFIIPKTSLPSWLEWGFWLSPLVYAEIGATGNEFHAPRWQKVKQIYCLSPVGIFGPRLEKGLDIIWANACGLFSPRRVARFGST
ncbi:hypothetical protein ACLB2K_061712 [Fragaria x ananassa]